MSTECHYIHPKSGHALDLKEKKMEVDWVCQQNYPKSGHALNPSRKYKEGTPKDPWRRSIDQEMKTVGWWSCCHMAKLAAD